MVTADDLLTLQRIDTDLEARRGALALAQTQAEAEDGLGGKREELEQARRTLRELEVAEKDLELKDEQLSQHLAEMERKLYSGRVGNPKELSDLNTDVGMLKRQRAELDERVLLLMEEVETARSKERLVDQELRDSEAAWRARLERLTSEVSAAGEKIAELESQRLKVVARLDKEALDRYNDLRERRRPAVVEIVRGVCGGCRVEVPDHLVKRARSGTSLASCASCNRILFVA
jgi:uncharacterized protein